MYLKLFLLMKMKVHHSCVSNQDDINNYNYLDEINKINRITKNILNPENASNNIIQAKIMNIYQIT